MHDDAKGQTRLSDGEAAGRALTVTDMVLGRVMGLAGELIEASVGQLQTPQVLGWASCQ